MLKNGRQMHSEVDFWIVSLLSPPPPPPSGPQSAFLGFNFLKPSQTIYKAESQLSQFVSKHLKGRPCYP